MIMNWSWFRDRPHCTCWVEIMKVLMSGVPRKTAYEIISGFYAGFLAMNYPVIEYREGLLRFLDIDEGFTRSRIRYDGTGQRIILEAD